ncbi:hypothetical protein BUALT_Bualt03G0074400 [Buddleja alternifolia]|uniref:Uncharacterized protein n=1 Tax=Buddleja alternifolia TaxID=168488 RepID=A0AAV6XT12_9LAMI|nr:hypothetical protein BUALT_Bualt03G0074400 [Buddleja alternifolia]
MHDNMAGRVPLEVGARGTIGSLVKMEIEYFRRLEVESVQSRLNSEEIASRGRSSWPKFRFSMVPWRKKKRRNSGIRPGICSMVEVADSQGLSEIPGFSYRSLKADSKRFEV